MTKDLLRLRFAAVSFAFFFVCLPFVAALFGVCCRFNFRLLPLRLPFIAVLIAEAERGGTRMDWRSGKLTKFDRYKLYDICCLCNTSS